MKVVIINSPLFRGKQLDYDEDSLPPIGLGYIASHLDNNGIDVELIDAVDRRMPLPDLIDTVNRSKPEVVATNIFTTNHLLVKELIESITYKAHVIVGGMATKELYQNILEWDTENLVDVVIGDGELITLDLINGCVKDTPFLFHDKVRVFKADKSSSYYLHDISGVKLNRAFFRNEPVKHPFGFIEANIIASRGCIYNCGFCAAARSLNRDFPVRERTEESLIKELAEIAQGFPNVNSIRVLDDLFLTNSKTIRKASDVFSKFPFQWRAMAHVMTFHQADVDLMSRLKNSGCGELFIGIESGSPTVLRAIKKTSNVATIINNISKVLKSGINVKGYFIFGFPGETVEDMEMTFQLAQELVDIATKEGVQFRTSVFQFRPYHATEIYYDLVKAGRKIEVERVEANKRLSHMVGRTHFNFHSGNYSNVDLDIVHDYIYRTSNLNSTELFKGIKLID